MTFLDFYGLENLETASRRVMNRQKCDARSCCSSVRPRGDRFSACRLRENVMHIPCILHTALRGASRVGAALGQLNARQVEQKNLFGEAYMQITSESKRIMINSLYRVMWV